jgi:hypothetical protein
MIMQRSMTQILLPLLLLIFLCFFIWKSTVDNNVVSSPVADTADTESARFMVKPFFTEENQIALALDGGNIPVARGQVPSVMIGKNIMRTVHLAWIHDWSNPVCRSIFQRLQLLYASEQGAALPALRIYLNPVYSDPAGEALQRSLLQVYFRSRIRENYLILASEISTGTLPADADAVRQRVEKLDPSLLADWDTPLEWLESDLHHTFSVAAIQLARNEAMMGQKIPAQLTAMDSILPPGADDQEIIAFLKHADHRQRIWLQASSPTMIPRDFPTSEKKENSAK